MKSGEYSNTLMKIMLAEDTSGHTALHIAAENNSEEALKKICEWAVAVATSLTHSLLLSQDKDSKTDGSWPQREVT